MKLIQVMFGVLFACAAAGKAAGAPQAPASEGKSTPAVATTPKEALKRMMLAGLTTDPKVVRPLFWTANELESESADVWVASTTGQDRLREAVRARFGDDGVKELTSINSPARPKPAEAEAAVEARLKDVQVKVDGDTATVTHPSQPKPIELRRTDAGWKAVFTSVYGRSDPKALQRYITLNRRWGPAYHATAEEVEKGKYPSVAEIKLALDDRLYPEDAALRRKVVPAPLPPANDRNR